MGGFGDSILSKPGSRLPSEQDVAAAMYREKVALRAGELTLRDTSVREVRKAMQWWNENPPGKFRWEAPDHLLDEIDALRAHTKYVINRIRKLGRKA